MKDNSLHRKIKIRILPTLVFGPVKADSFVIYTCDEGYIKVKQDLTADQLYPILKRYIKREYSDKDVMPRYMVKIDEGVSTLLYSISDVYQEVIKFQQKPVIIQPFV